MAKPCLYAKKKKERKKKKSYIFSIRVYRQGKPSLCFLFSFLCQLKNLTGLNQRR
uniref:Macaca fascicularis brain cDNA clone: QflA-21994, similar to human hypothetical protein DKFZp434K046 (DKFZP434K046), mRNA, RefSeq: NM_020312.1 n=1 Tax=Macaca fascicularis TaxID=9541 RepID=I7GIR5_MACFA|nr:unnamed protein product [Macaca fascicularis]